MYRTQDRKDRRYGKGGVLLQSGAIKYAYDVTGNVIVKELPDGKKWRYEWSRAGHLKSVETPDGKKVSFEYDALGRRISKKVGDTTTRWMWSGNVPIHEWREREGDGDGGNGQGGQDDVATTWVFEPDTFVPIAKITSDGKRHSIISDYLGTPKEMRDEAGELAWKAQLDIYGAATVEEGERDDCPWRWQGQYEDVETGLYYNRFRYYDPVRGDYISQDPIRLLGGMRMYGYVEDPLAWSDPFGLAILFRGERPSMTPESVFSNGFAPKGTGTSLLAHTTSNTAKSMFVSTSESLDIATGFAGKNGWVYVIDTERGINVNAVLGAQSPFPEQLEHAIPGGVLPGEVVGAYKVNKGVREENMRSKPSCKS